MIRRVNTGCRSSRRLQFELLDRRVVLSASPLVDAPAASISVETLPADGAIEEVVDTQSGTVEASVEQGESMDQYQYDSPQPLDALAVDEVLASSDDVLDTEDAGSPLAEGPFVDVGISEPLEGAPQVVDAAEGEPVHLFLTDFNSSWLGEYSYHFYGSVTYEGSYEDLTIQFDGLFETTDTVESDGTFSYFHDFGQEITGDVSAYATDGVDNSNLEWETIYL